MSSISRQAAAVALLAAVVVAAGTAQAPTDTLAASITATKGA